MIYLIGKLALWLFLVVAFAALAGWAYASRRSEPAERSLRRERDNLQRDLIGIAMGEAGAANDEGERVRAEDSVRSQLSLRDARVAELEHALERARATSDDATSQVAELQRRVENADTNARELERLRALETARDQQQLVDARVDEPEPDQEDVVLQAWRLRYFEQRVRYLEGLARAQPAAAPAEESVATDNLSADWRAREAEARAAFLENEMRSAVGAPTALDHAADPETPFAANADVDMLLRWRLLYLERRVAHLQAAAQLEPEAVPEAPVPQPAMAEAGPDPDRWKWRARYLESRVRHLEQRPVMVAEPAPLAETPAPEPEQVRRKPPVLSSPRNGAPDDLTLIEGVSALQQTTLYSIGVFHFDQIAVWTPENVAWIDNYLRLRGRIGDEDWIDQADALARELAGA